MYDHYDAEKKTIRAHESQEELMVSVRYGRLGQRWLEGKLQPCPALDTAA